MKTDKQSEVLHYLQTVESAALSDIYKNVSFGYYANAHKHLGDLLSRMIKNKSIIRIKKGVFAINKEVRHTTKKAVEIPKEQTKFNF